MQRSKFLLIAGMAVAGIGGAAAALNYFLAPEPNAAVTAVATAPQEPAQAEAVPPAPADETASIAATAAALSAKPDTNPDRRLMGVFRTQPEARSRAFVGLKGQVASYAPGDKLPPDDAVLTRIEERYVLLQPPAGGPLLLALESTNTNQAHEPPPLPRERQPPLGMKILDGLGDDNPVRRLLGRQEPPPRNASAAPSRSAPARPAAAADAADEDDEDFDPYASCEQLVSTDEQLGCEERIDAEIERLEETCDEIEDADAWDLCTEAASRMAVSNTAGTGATPPPE